MKVLVVGGGGREHTLVWKINQSPKVDKIYAAPGNAGISQIAQCVDIEAEEIAELVDFAEREKIDLTVVGPEAPLMLGIVDEFEGSGLRIFGPSKAAAMIEGSKVFAKDLMRKYGIPTADFRIFASSREASDYIRERGAPIVVKADGLAAGKGSIVCSTIEEALEAVDLIMIKRSFGEAGNKVVIEDCLEGEEASVIALTDGKTIVPLVSSQDHKRAFDGDQGPNTGGMGAYAPAPVITEDVMERIDEEILQPAIRAMREEGKLYRGVLYAGVIITDESPEVLEFNCRFGDPENQVELPLFKTDLVEAMIAVTEGKLEEVEIEHENRAAVCVVLASGGYPGSYETGKRIFGLEEAGQMTDVILFHAGTSLKDGDIVTSGGRVLGVTAVGDDVQEAILRAYEAVDKISFEKMYYRKDIGHRALARLRG